MSWLLLLLCYSTFGTAALMSLLLCLFAAPLNVQCCLKMKKQRLRSRLLMLTQKPLIVARLFIVTSRCSSAGQN